MSLGDGRAHDLGRSPAPGILQRIHKNLEVEPFQKLVTVRISLVPVNCNRGP